LVIASPLLLFGKNFLLSHMATEKSTAYSTIRLHKHSMVPEHRKKPTVHVSKAVGSTKAPKQPKVPHKAEDQIDCPRRPVESILLDSPSASEHRVSFDFKPKVKEITAYNAVDEGKKSAVRKPRKRKQHCEGQPRFEIVDRSLVLPKAMTKVAKLKAKKFSALVSSETSVTLKYKRRDDMEADMRSLGLLPKTYIENKLIVHNLSFRDTEETVAECFGQLAEVEKVVLEKNSKGVCTGKGTVTFCSGFYPGKEGSLYELRLSGRLLRIERIKKQLKNKTRLFISHIRKSIKISELRAILKKAGYVPKSIKIDLNENRNKGYGFVEFHTEEQAERFIKAFHSFKEVLGAESFVEYSQEKQSRMC